MKILDRFLIRSFIPPFLVAFGIALFVLIMQFLWLYIDEIMGKGLSIFEVVELLFYLTIGLFPQAFPIGVLIASVMVMGNLGERYELSSFKSAGVSLLRIMRPLMFVAAGISIFSIFTAEILIPWSNLKFYSRFYDIRKSKPALNLEAGVFNDEFAAYTMRVGKKSADGRKIENVLIYGNKEYNTTTYNQTMAKSGEMLTTADKQFFVMNLYDGVQFQETSNNASNSGKYPFVRIKYKSWQKIFDLTEFDRRKTDEDLFRSSQKTQSSKQLIRAIDSMGLRLEEARKDMLREMKERLSPYKTPIKVEFDTAGHGSEPSRVGQPLPTSGVVRVDTPLSNSVKKSEKQAKTNSEAQAVIDSFSKNALSETPFKSLPARTAVPKDTFISKFLGDSFYSIINKVPRQERSGFYQKAVNNARISQTSIENMMRNNQVTIDQQSKFTYELNLKYVFALICFVFLFVGAPMGAIVQKGGFGYPILVAIIFFMIFMIGVIYCKNLRDGRSLSGVQAAWIPFFLMLPIAVLLTYRAVNDYKMSFDGIGKNLKNLFLTIAQKMKQVRAKTAIFCLLFAFFTEGGLLAQNNVFETPLDTTFQVETPEGDVIEEDEEQPYVSPYVEAQKKYNSEPIEARSVSSENWRKATQGIDYQGDVEKEQKGRTPSAPNTPSDTRWVLPLIAVLKWVFVGIAVLLLGYLILRFVGEGNIFLGKGRRLATSEVIDLEEIEENLEQAELDPLIRQAIEARNFPLATRLYYLAILKELMLKNAIVWKRDKTNRTYLNEMRPHPLFESFRSVTSIFERVWYGDSILDSPAFNQIQPAFQDLLNRTRQRT